MTRACKTVLGVVVALAVMAIGACAEGGPTTQPAPAGSGGGGSSPGSGSPTSAAALIAQRGTPTLFDVECGRHAYDAGSARWEPQPGFVRMDTWLYANDGGTDVFSLVNGHVIKAATSARNIGNYPNPGINPRAVGCGELRPAVALVAGGAPSRTTRGTDAGAALLLGAVQIEVDFHIIKGRSALSVTYANSKMVGMSSL